MRKALNENPVVQMVFVGILVVVVGFLFITRLGGGSAAEAPTATPETTPTAPTSGTAVPAPGALADPAASTAAGVSPAPAVAVGSAAGFEPGPGLPKAVVEAYEGGETIVVLVLSKGGIDDAKLERSIGAANEGGETALFVVDAKQIADYSRITQGVRVDRAPALVVVHPKRLSGGSLPEASVSYGFRGAQSIRQAVRDAAYNGRENVPYYPE